MSIYVQLGHTICTSKWERNRYYSISIALWNKNQNYTHHDECGLAICLEHFLLALSQNCEPKDEPPPPPKKRKA